MFVPLIWTHGSDKRQKPEIRIITNVSLINLDIKPVSNVINKPNKKPILIWAIIIISVLSWLWIAFSFAALFGGFIPKDEVNEVIQKLSFVDISLSVISACINFIALFYLIKLNSKALVWWGSYFIFLLIIHIFNSTTNPNFSSSDKISSISGLIFQLIIFMYILFLKSRNIITSKN